MATDSAYREKSESSDGSTASTGKRIASAIAGGALMTVGLRRRSLGGIAAALAGGWLLYRGVRGRSRSQSTPESDATEGGGEEEQTEHTETQSKKTAVERSVTIGRPADELYDLWGDPEQLNRVLGDAAEVNAEGDGHQRWTVEGPLGRSVEWKTQTVEDRPGEVLRWESVEDSRVSGEGAVRFRPAPGDRGTEVTLELRFDPPGGRVGETAMDLLGFVPESLAGTALDRLKSLAETGEIPSLDRNPSARGQGDMV